MGVAAGAKSEAQASVDVDPFFVFRFPHVTAVAMRPLARAGAVGIRPFQDLANVKDGPTHISNQSTLTGLVFQVRRGCVADVRLRWPRRGPEKTRPCGPTNEKGARVWASRATTWRLGRLFRRELAPLRLGE